MRQLTLLTAVVVGIGLVQVCGCDSNTNTNNNGMDGGSTDDLSGIVGPEFDGDIDAFIAEHDGDVPPGFDLAVVPPLMCTGGAGCPCASGADCISGVCDAANKICIDISCGNAGATCATSADCCGLLCVNKLCGGQCLADTKPCGTDADCCSTLCVPGDGGMVCATLNPGSGCKTAGNPCTDNSNCCNHVCTAMKQCAAPSQVSFCTQINDICHTDGECCTGVCKFVGTTHVGTCAAISTVCTVDGLACSGCGSCCSHFCGPFGSLGSEICQPASGCRVQGDTCRTRKDCCGGDPAAMLPGTNGFGLVVCTPDPTYPSKIGTCSTPNKTNCPAGTPNCDKTCQPTGDVCHFSGTAVCQGSTTNVRNDCCQCISDKTCCKPDRAGIPRCNLVGTCQPEGAGCTSAADCCNNVPCVPDATGSLHCLVTPDGSIPCVGPSGSCTTNADCCTGLLCITPPGSVQGTCINPTPPPPTDMAGVAPQDLAGVVLDLSQPPACAQYGQACSTGVTCCNGVTCVFASNGQACTSANTADCLCFFNIP